MKHFINLVLLLSGLISIFFSLKLLNKSMLLKWKVMLLKKIFSIEILLCFDWISSLFFGVLLIIVYSVKKFSLFYLKDDKNFSRFFWMLMLFVFSMCLLMFIPSFVFVLVGWDGLGLTSFFLIMYYNSFSSWTSGLKTYLIKRLGDGLVMVSLLSFYNQGHWKILVLDKNMDKMIMFILILGLFTKSAQYPFSSWLPAAMAAPTPVSALVHSSTLVTAGVYLLVRFSEMFSYEVKSFIGVVSLYTLFVASFSACVEWDMKKMMAFSTLSQLGLMCFSMSCGLSLLGFFHLITHAVFKALLFISAGFLLGQVNHFQDLRQLKSLKKMNPFIDFSMLTSILSLSGFPFLAGFFSKDLIMENKMSIGNLFFMGFFWMSLGLTVFYSLRMMFFLYYQKMISSKMYLSLEATKVLACGPLLLSSIMVGYFLKMVFLKKNKLSLFFKLLMVLLLILGSLPMYFNLDLKFYFMWYFSNISFIESFNSTLLTKELSHLGKILFNYDQGLCFNNKSILNKNMLLMNSSSVKFYLKKMKMHFFLLKMFVVTVFLKFL